MQYSRIINNYFIISNLAVFWTRKPAGFVTRKELTFRKLVVEHVGYNYYEYG